MRERSLVAFTLLLQTAVGVFWTLVAISAWGGIYAGSGAARDLTAAGWPVVGLLAGTGVLASLFHLGDPANAWRALANLRSSWLSREVLLACSFAASSLLFAGLRGMGEADSTAEMIAGTVAGFFGLALVCAMAGAYRLRTIPAWDSWVTPASFLLVTP